MSTIVEIQDYLDFFFNLEILDRKFIVIQHILTL